MVPTGELDRESVLATFRERRARTLEFARTTEAPLASHVHPSPFFGPLNAYHWLLYIPLHHMRHAAQMAEVMDSPGFPKREP